jgi:hypothetical protein
MFTFPAPSRQAERPETRRAHARRPLVEDLEGRRFLSGVIGSHIGMSVAPAIQGNHIGMSVAPAIQGNHIGTSAVWVNYGTDPGTGVSPATCWGCHIGNT